MLIRGAWSAASTSRSEEAGSGDVADPLRPSEAYGQQSGWSAYDQSMSDKARDIR
jgi:hypothetical protein